VQVRDAVAVVVGASGGIGAATVDALARAGAHLVLSAPASERARLETLAGDARATGARVLVAPADVTVRSEIDALVAAALAEFGRIDVVAYIAGIGSSPSLLDSTDDEIARVLDVNLLGCARVMHAVMPVMKRRQRGVIVNVGSIAGEAGVMGVYSASKFGMRGLTDSVRRELRADGVQVVLIQPGFVRTAMNAAMGDTLPGPEVVADALVDAIRHPVRVRIIPRRYVVPVMLARIFPGLLDLVFGDARIQQRLNRDARAERASKAAG